VEKDRDELVRRLRARPPGADPLSVVDYLYLGQLPRLLFAAEIWQEARERFFASPDAKQTLQTAIEQILPVRNHLAHVREVPVERLQRASLACTDVLSLIRAN
jgi:hypothetical protein